MPPVGDQRGWSSPIAPIPAAIVATKQAKGADKVPYSICCYRGDVLWATTALLCRWGVTSWIAFIGMCSGKNLRAQTRVLTLVQCRTGVASVLVRLVFVYFAICRVCDWI